MAIFFSQRKSREFGYRPRYYDPAAEEREQRKRVVLGEKYKPPGQPEYVPGSILREHVAARRGASAAANMRKRRRRASRPIVLVGILVVIVLILIQLFK